MITLKTGLRIATKMDTTQCLMQPNMPLKFQFDRLTLTPVRARRKSDIKTDTPIVKTTFLDVLIVVHPKSGLISKSIFCTMPTLPWDMEVKRIGKRPKRAYVFLAGFDLIFSIATVLCYDSLVWRYKRIKIQPYKLKVYLESIRPITSHVL